MSKYSAYTTQSLQAMVKHLTLSPDRDAMKAELAKRGADASRSPSASAASIPKGTTDPVAILSYVVTDPTASAVDKQRAAKALATYAGRESNPFGEKLDLTKLVERLESELDDPSKTPPKDRARIKRMLDAYREHATSKAQAAQHGSALLAKLGNHESHEPHLVTTADGGLSIRN